MMARMRLILGCGALALLLAGCGAQTTAQGGASTATATTAPQATPVPTVSASVLNKCFGAGASQRARAV